MAAGRFDLLAKIFQALSGINGSSGGYNLTTAKTETYIRDWNDTATFPRPWVGFRPTTETYSYEMSHRIRCTMGLQVVAHLTPSGSTQSDIIDDQMLIPEKYSDDIIKALRQDVVRAGCAESITLQRTETTQGDASQAENVSLSMLFNVVYYRTEPTS